MSDAVLNTDRELYRGPDVDGNGDYYSDSIHVTQGGSIGINVGGLVIVKPLSEWHGLAQETLGQDYINTQQARIDELEAANDAAEKSNRISDNGNMWRFWSDKSREYTIKNVKLQARIDKLEAQQKLDWANINTKADYIENAMNDVAIAIEQKDRIDKLERALRDIKLYTEEDYALGRAIAALKEDE